LRRFLTNAIRAASVDWPNIAEEIETLGRSERKRHLAVFFESSVHETTACLHFVSHNLVS
jgi:hypothetical protein